MVQILEPTCLVQNGSVIIGEIMKNVVIFDPSVGSTNTGDQIILEAVERELLLAANRQVFLTRITLHQGLTRKQIKTCQEADLVVVSGSNMLKGEFSPLRRRKRWQLTLTDAIQLGNVLLFGPGWSHFSHPIKISGKVIYGLLLSKTFCHSVRDEFTAERMRALGFANVMNTACPTMWGFTDDHLNRIPRKKAKTAVTTVSDYNKDVERDSSFLRTLLAIYDRVYVWPQGSNDYRYIQDLNIQGLEFLPPSLPDYDNFLSADHDLDYVGTRLHGGIRALQHQRRALIISVDQRAKEIARDTGLAIIPRSDIGKLADVCQSEIHLDIKLPVDKIEAFRSQIREVFLL